MWTADAEHGEQVAAQVRTGVVAINSSMILDFNSPFGGFKKSGIGRELGPEGIDPYTELPDDHPSRRLSVERPGHFGGDRGPPAPDAEEARMLLDGVNHVALLTNDTERLHAFYREVFDATVIHEERPEPGMRICRSSTSDRTRN